MAKRKRSSDKRPEGSNVNTGSTDPGDADSEKVDMAHVSPDLLAGSPDTFAPKPVEEPAPEPVATALPEPVADPVAEAAPQPVTEAVSEPEAVASLPVQAPDPVSTGSAADLPTPYSAPSAVPQLQPSKPGNVSLALGVVLVVVGLFALAVAVSGADLTQYGWPLFVIVPGLTLLVVGFVGAGAGASVPGGIITMLGLVLAYQDSSGDWESWTFLWPAVAPFGVGLGMYLQALRDRDSPALRRGRNLMFLATILFIVSFVIFESILGVSGRDYGIFGKAALPLLLIAFGLVLLVRNTRRSKKA